MGHDVHFLDRLRRVSPAEADLALGLYRNVELVELLLAEAKVPVDAPRLAVALSDAAEPPYIVLARDGGFVTCLGAGMAPRNLPVVPFRFLASTAGRLDRILTKARAYRALAQSLGPFRNAYDRIYTHGDELTREEAVAFMSVTPEDARVYVENASHAVERIFVSRAIALRRHGPGRGPEAAKQLWKKVHAAGNLIAFSARGLGEATHTRPGAFHTDKLISALTGTAAEVMHAFVVVRCARTLAQLGKPAVAELKQRLSETTSVSRFLSTLAALTCVGLRHERLSAEIRKVIDRRIWSFAIGGSADAKLGEVLEARFLAPAQQAMALAEQAPGFAAETARRVLLDRETRLASLDERAPRWKDEKEVPDQPAVAFFAHILHTPFSVKGWRNLMFALPSIAKAPVEDLYLTREDWGRFGIAPDAESHAEYVEFLRSWTPKSEPVRAAAKPGRNDPCPCGSGRKFKKCHAEADPSVQDRADDGADAPVK